MRQDDRARHKLDEIVDRIRNQSDLEGRLENRRNTLVENHPYLIGYAFLMSLVATVTLTHLMVFTISFLFFFFISDFMTTDVHRVAPFLPRAVLFSLLHVLIVLLIILITYKIIPMILKNLPELSTQLQLHIVEELKAASQKWDLSAYINVDELSSSILKASTGILHFLAATLTPLYKGFVQFIFALGVNLFFYFESEKVEQAFARNPDSLMTFLFRFLQTRLRIFYAYFRRVMGGQLIIALINTLISSVVIFALGLHHPFLMIFVVFFCGIFPVVGNLMSNSVLTINAFITSGLWGTLVCLVMLIGIHKLEYFLNSRIIGGIMHLPMTISLGALIFCEVLLGIPGLILAMPLVVFVRHELEHIGGLPSGLPEEDALTGKQPGENKGRLVGKIR